MRSLFAIAAMAFAAPAGAMTHYEVFREQMHMFWGPHLDDSTVQTVTGKLNSDDDDDTLGWRIEDNAFQLIAVVWSEKYNAQVANIRIPVGKGGVCNTQPEVTLEAWSEDARTAHGLRHVGPNAIRILAGDCEPIYLFWPDNVSHAAVDLRIPRK